MSRLMVVGARGSSVIGIVRLGVETHCASLSYPFSLIKLLPTSSAAAGVAKASEPRESENSDVPVFLSARFEIGYRHLESREGSRLRSLSDQPLEECLSFSTRAPEFVVEQEPPGM